MAMTSSQGALRDPGLCCETPSASKWHSTHRAWNAMAIAYSQGALRDPGLCCETPSVSKWRSTHRERNALAIAYSQGALRDPGLCCETPLVSKWRSTSAKTNPDITLRAFPPNAEGVAQQSPGSCSAPWVQMTDNLPIHTPKALHNKAQGRAAHPGCK